MKSIKETLEERGANYGSFAAYSEYAQAFKNIAMRSQAFCKHMQPYQREALDLMFGKLARILNGDPMYVDSWHDISGYATLVVNELERGKKS